jgi:glutamate-5-semialdehyde dehydrogenase
MSVVLRLERLIAGTPILVGGDRYVTITPELAAAFAPGDSLAVLPRSGEILHIKGADRDVASAAVTRAYTAFQAMSRVSDEQISTFFLNFAERLDDPSTWEKIAAANHDDVQRAKTRGRSTTRLEATEQLRRNMVEGLLGWANAPSQRGKVLETVRHPDWVAELIAAELGVVAFIFEGRPNVVADATGVLRGGNTVVFRIGRDALGTARAMLEYALEPALRQAGLPSGAVSLVDSASHGAGWALFTDQRLSLAVARGSGPAVDSLGALAQSSGIPVSLHGTGGAWMVAAEDADPKQVEEAVYRSLDRKVCNTLNTFCVPRAAAPAVIPAFLRGLDRAAARRHHAYKLHVAQGSETYVPDGIFEREVQVGRAEGLVNEPQAESLAPDRLGHEWEWEDSPEVTLVVVDSVSHATELFNAQSPRFVACLVSPDNAAHESFYRAVNAPFVGDHFTRWVDGQFALKRPELGLSNWERGRLFGRGGILSGDSVFTVRTRYRSL